MINFKPVIKLSGALLLLLGVAMLTGLIPALYFDSGDAQALLLSSGLTIGLGLPLFLSVRSRQDGNIRKREGYLIVALGWITMATASTLPYVFSGTIPNWTDALFESISGITTTGASVVTDIEALPQGILYWRSLTQWIGGMGIIVLTVAIFPLLGIGGIELFVAEAPGPTSDKLHPRIRETARRLWFIYLGLTAALIPILYFAGMSFFEAINHAFTTMATGGFSTRNASIAHWDNPLIQYPIIIFMFLAGTNFTITYFGLKGKWKRVWCSDEFKAYLGLILLLSAVVTISVYQSTDLSLEKAFRDSAFQVVSIITTTGFVSADYTAWNSGLTMLFFVLLFMGASAGSTSGGIKVIRHLVFFKNSFLEFRRLIHPRAVVPLKINGQLVSGKIIIHIIIFLLLYLMLFVAGSITVSIMGLDFLTAIGAVATALGNVGPGIGEVGPVDNFAWLPQQVKWVLCLLMLMGRLELFTILVLFSPYFWRSN
jgi:trk system potassium uptake protein TrkH